MSEEKGTLTLEETKRLLREFISIYAKIPETIEEEKEFSKDFMNYLYRTKRCFIDSEGNPVSLKRIEELVDEFFLGKN